MWQPLIYLIILSSTVKILTQSNPSCPESCTCRNFPCKTLDSFCFKTTVRCATWNRTFNLPNTTNQLEIIGVDENILCGSFSYLGELQLLESLTIRASDISNISKCFKYLTTNIKDLKLQQNNLTEFPQLFVSNNSNLRTLDFSENSIKFVGEIKFLRTLETLNLSGNSISYIKSYSFNALVSLKTLDLSTNNLSTLNKELFQHLTKLKLLNLSYNNIRTLQQDYFSDLPSLEQLDLSFNKLIKVNLENLNLPNLTSLYLTGNTQVGKLNNLLVGASKKLKFVDASNSEMEKIPGVLTQSVRTLKLTKNNIKSINCGELDAYPLLQLLDLSSNKIEFVEDDSFGRLEFLTVLYLEDNKLKNIPKSLPEQVVILHLQSNNISQVNKDDLEGLFNLEVLNLRDNKIKFIEDQAFSNLTSLATMDLSQNPISILSLNSLYGPSCLQALRLSAIGTISPAKDMSFPLLSPENLIILDLSHSAGLARQMLNDEAFLDAAKQLQELDLSDNGLEIIRSDLFHFLPQLRLLHIQNNQLDCSGLEWLASWMRRQDYSDYSSIICSQPTYLRGLPLVDLQYVEATSIRTINQLYKPINQVRKSGTTTYQVGQYDGGQKTSYKITMGAKNNDYDENIDSVREAKTRQDKASKFQKEGKSFGLQKNQKELEVQKNMFQQENKSLLGQKGNSDANLLTKYKTNVTANTVAREYLSLIDKKKSSDREQLSLTRPASNVNRSNSFYSSTPLNPTIDFDDTLFGLINNDQLSMNFRNNKTHLNSGSAVSRNNISSTQRTQNAVSNRQTKYLNNTNARLAIQSDLKHTSNENYSVNVASRSRNQSEDGFINNLNPLSPKTEDENNLNQDRESNKFAIETPRGKTNLISTYRYNNADFFSQKTNVEGSLNLGQNIQNTKEPMLTKLNESLKNSAKTMKQENSKMNTTLQNKQNIPKQNNLSYKLEQSQSGLISTLKENPLLKLYTEKNLHENQLLNHENGKTESNSLTYFPKSDQPKLSMYTKENPSPTFLHPGMIILTVGILSGVLTLIFLAAKLQRNRKATESALCGENIEVSEVSTLPNVTELW